MNDDHLPKVSLRRLKTRAREIQQLKSIKRSAALEEAAKEAGFSTYHEAQRALSDVAPAQPDEHDAPSLSKRVQAVLADIRAAPLDVDPPDTDLESPAFDKASSGLYSIFGLSNNKNRLDEIELAVFAGHEVHTAAFTSQWLLAMLDMPMPSSTQDYRTNIIVICDRDYRFKPRAFCPLSDPMASCEQIAEMIGLPGTRVGLAPVGSIIGPLEESKESMLGDWLQLVDHARARCNQMLDGTLRFDLQPGQGSVSELGHGDAYVFFGRVACSASHDAELDRLLREYRCCAGAQIPQVGFSTPLRVRFMAPASYLLQMLYPTQMKQCFGFANRLIQELGSLDNVNLLLRVCVRDDGHEVDITAQLPHTKDSVAPWRSMYLGRCDFPVYLHAALRSAIEPSMGYEIWDGYGVIRR
jgi:hypothetical protein